MKPERNHIKNLCKFWPLILPGIAYYVTLYVTLIFFNKISFSLSSLISLHRINPLLFLADLFPVVLIFSFIQFCKKYREMEMHFQSAFENNKLLYERYAEQAKRIGTGDFTLPIITEGPDDKLGNALIMLQSFLRSNEKKEKQQSWISEGKDIIFRILRTHTNLNELTLQILKTLINYIEACQGALYLYDNERKVLVNTAHYAFNRRRYVNQEFKIGESLVGECGYEMDYIYRTEIPEDYITITSGILGDRKPASILLIPLISDNSLQGVVELAFLQEKIPKLKIQFMLELGEIIGRTLHNLKLSHKTESLLNESQKMTAELRSNENKLQENARLMKKTQEELQKINTQLKTKINEVENAQGKLHWLLENASEVISIYDHEFRMTYISPSVTKILGYTPEEMKQGKDFERLTKEGDTNLRKFLEYTASEEKENPVIQYSFIKKDGERIFLETSAKNMLNDQSIKGIILNSRDITEKIRAEREERLKSRMQSLSENSLDLILRLSTEGQFYYVNPVMEDYTLIDTKHLTKKFLSEIEINEVLKNYFTNTLIKISENPRKINTEVSVPVKMGEIISERIINFDAIPEMSNNELETILFVGHDITEAKKIQKEIQIKNKNIEDSINYAKKIQGALLPDFSLFTNYFPQSFVFYKPRDVVSGDLPWFYVKDEWIYIAAIDCTGHGVPGALLSFVAYFLLNNAVSQFNDPSPSEILNLLNENVRHTLKQENNKSENHDGMDIALCKINHKNLYMEYAGAHRPLFLLRQNELTEYKGDRRAIGGLLTSRKTERSFNNYNIKLKKRDKIFLFTDGLTDQLGGPYGRKYTANRVKDLILENKNNEMQKSNLYSKTILLIGIKEPRQLDELC